LAEVVHLFPEIGMFLQECLHSQPIVTGQLSVHIE
jgi:hypothetical protein